MKHLKTAARIVAAVALTTGLLAGEARARETIINGAGASFPNPVYSKWMYQYHDTTGVKVNYNSIGSGGGIRAIKAGTVDFGASDAPLTKKELDEAGLIQFPMVMGGVVPVFNLPGVKAGELTLNGEVLAMIYLGRITAWDDARIQALNPELQLPDREITVVHRADSSGTTWIFTNYLCKVSEAWAKGPGHGKAPKWPTGVAGPKNDGVAKLVRAIPFSIGYVEYAYALTSNMATAKMKNQAGKAVAPTIETFQSAAAHADWKHAPGFYMVLTDQPGEESWPITGATFILIYKNQPDADKARAMLRYFDWCFDHGDRSAKELHYVPMPDNVVKLVQDVWSEQVTGDGEKLWP
jgi:phosphate transport system substrate-binding protein